MPETKRRFVTVCQQLLAIGTVAALAAPAVGVVSLDIVSPSPAPAKDLTAAAPSEVALVASEAVEPEVTETRIRGVEQAGLQALTSRPALQRKAAEDLAALSAPAEVDGFATVGVTWSAAEDLGDDEVTVSVRSLEDGEWGAWQPIEYDADHGPDPDSAEAQKVRAGTDPIVVGDVDEVQVKVETVDGEAPARAELVVVDPKPTPDPVLSEPAIDTADLPDGGAVALSSATGDPSEPTGPEAPASAGPPAEVDGVLTGATVTPKPQIFSRAQWGADERMRDKSSLAYYEVHAGFVHHTVNANGYTREQVPSLLRGIYAYHTQSRGWSDIGYNFVVDRFGRIWEGRYGGVDRPVVGAHTLGYNEYSFAMSALGNFETATAPRAMLRAYGRLFGWKLSLHGVSASSAKQWVGKKWFPAINGHRDAGQTACPGRNLYAKLGRIRTLAANYQKPFAGRNRSTNLAGSGWPDLVVRDRVSKRLVMLRTGGQTNFQGRKRTTLRWGGMDLVAAPGDLTGDRIPDLVARSKTTKSAGVYPGTSSGGFANRLAETTRFSTADQLVGVPDLDGDGTNDVVARVASTKRLILHRGNGKGGFLERMALSPGAWSYDLTAAAGDFDGDGRNDLLARSGGRLHVVPGRGTSLGTPVALPYRWGQYSLISGGSDLTMDGEPDILVKTGTSEDVYVYPGDGKGGIQPRLGPFTQFAGMNRLAPVGQMTGDGNTDLVARNGKGRVFVYTHNGRRNIEAITDTGIVLADADVVLNVGDWNGDGVGDVMTRSVASGSLYLHTGDGQGRFGAALLAAKGFGGVTHLAAVGDITGDGRPDLMGQPAGKGMRIYPGNGSSGFQASYVAHSGISATAHTGLGLWNADGSPDSLVRREDGSVALYPGNGPGGLLAARKLASGMRQYDWVTAVGDATGDGRPDVLARVRKDGRLVLFPGNAGRTGFGKPRLVATGLGGYDITS